ncbi:PQQ-dependent dehydrogenase, methanol/ethanol family [Phenylobacterium sp.]|jgi:alcohol dehydrogenase (cytochrome c)|uniref:PQQ-dependent dehydrogenase, methanol/ethanol family n=1 Tax=Phenylobacterium sp. TaxID=1871053 RepID=UPI002E32CD1D|nr:PQQ-dependent dehydrogenase, methanol/ethanol family [Phenylobacterium sp.]HEX3365693.1 PQQ-dependent dehydrogenase, methanol/ethanol family [Phenylobacterium sp.]
MTRPFTCACLAALALLAGCERTGDPKAPPSPVARPQPGATGATANFAPNDPPGEWRRQARDYANTRFSPLDQVGVGNVARLKMAWSFSDGIPYGHEAAPLVVGDTMYVVTPYPNVAYALDLTKPGAPIKWTYQPHPDPIAVGKACCDAVNRGPTYADGKLVFTLLDGEAVAVDAKTGRPAWRTRLGEPASGMTITMSPLVVGNAVLVGNSGGEMGVRGQLTALDLSSGKEIWRGYSTGPDADVKIGADYRAPYLWLAGKDLGLSSWPGDAWKRGGGTVWGWISYDPDLNLIYEGTSNPSPRVPAQRPGDNLWSSALFARDPKTGSVHWGFQFTPHDQWDYDGVNENILIDGAIGGQTRKLLVHLDRNGYGYTLDRTTGRILVAKPFAPLNWAKGIDLATGRPIVDPDKQAKVEENVQNICPTHIGSKDWQPAAFSPRTGLIYADIFNICMDLTDHKVSYIPGTPYDGMDLTTHAGGKTNKWGEFIAWNPLTGERAWSIPENFMTMSGVLATAGDLVFYGTTDGWFRAVDARSGKVLWSQKLSSGITSQPMTYLGPDGRQYVAVVAGVGGVASQVMGQKNGFPPRGGTLYVFSIDGASPGSAPNMLTTQGSKAPGAVYNAPD